MGNEINYIICEVKMKEKRLSSWKFKERTY